MEDYPLLNLFWTMLWLFLWVMWFFLLFKVVTDIFRDHGLGGWAKAGWLVLVLVLPYLGVLVYLIARGKSMSARDAKHAKEHEEAVRQYIQKTAGSGSNSVDDLSKLAELKDKGHITPEEFQRAKTKLLA
ncbi:SHOCT domain-containing protein [Streptomyces sp. SID1034]|uniref:SHOCT domain-containing protein n=1 Tax=Streptomyces sp. SID1034 TaxID=2690248 RepID=UPI00136D1E31|nr:SHOCT domain-containing protein [Streptomyces sp. SID1034]MYV91101.1 SHOCT domain-containing protein [Streptomyces sp. SID1034]